ncbi:hypothetical protein ACIRSU_01570 [Streptomyces sp. NPDC101160]|uniref:hypothetical protein n=1 Tax=Streptomyces sp. NPDC101160 TaxID=3366118 RepID=UPI003804E09F
MATTPASTAGPERVTPRGLTALLTTACLSGEAPGRPRPAWRWDEARGGWAAETEPAPGWTRRAGFP